MKLSQIQCCDMKIVASVIWKQVWSKNKSLAIWYISTLLKFERGETNCTSSDFREIGVVKALLLVRVRHIKRAAITTRAVIDKITAPNSTSWIKKINKLDISVSYSHTGHRICKSRNFEKWHLIRKLILKNGKRKNGCFWEYDMAISRGIESFY